MLKRIYADNFRSLVNFELHLDRTNLLLGENGSGKTTVFEVLYRLQQFLSGNAKVSSLFPSNDLTRWQDYPTQRFELDLSIEAKHYAYSLAIEHHENRRSARVKREVLQLDGMPLFEFEEGTARLYRDDFMVGPEYPFDWTQSGLAALQPRPDNRKLTRFRSEVARFIIASLHPMNMSPESREEESLLSRNMENFVSWYRFISQEHQGAMVELFQELGKVMPGFSSISLKEAGEARVFRVLMKQPGGNGRQQLSHAFSELSEGQRSLIALYSLLFALKDQGVSLFLDEPDNFVALREIQPWLTALTDLAGEGIEQAVLISHHPEIINYLGPSSGRWFEREANGPTRVGDKPKSLAPGLTLAETIARGWEK